MDDKVTTYINTQETWQAELLALRNILLKTPLEETLKWQQPCYMLDGTNLVMIHSFKAAVSVSFFTGSLLKDSKHMLTSPGQNSQAMRYMKFENVNDIIDHEQTILSYIHEAINLQKAGVKVQFKDSKTFELPDELLKKFLDKPELKASFEALTPGRQRAYALYFSSAKQSETRRNRIEKYEDHILDGKGINDR